MKFIALAGVDGSGKSTQVELLQSHLEANGKKVAYFHAVEFSLANRIARLFRGTKTFQPGAEKAVTRASLFQVLLRQEFLFWDMLRFRFWQRHLRLEGYDYLVSDRSFYDSLINLEYLADSPLARCGRAVLEKVMPPADKVFFLDIPVEVIMSRGRAPEQGAEYLEKKLVLFRSKIEAWNLIVIDANREKDAILEDIKAQLEN